MMQTILTKHIFLTFLLVTAFMGKAQGQNSGNKIADTVNLTMEADTLIPLINGLFASRPKLIHSDESDEILKRVQLDDIYSYDAFGYGTPADWGVTDSLGKVILPFMYHGVKAIDANYGVAIIIDQAVPPPTGLVRTEFHVSAFYFDQKGPLSEKGKSYKCVLVGNLHESSIVSYLLDSAPPLEHATKQK